ncbi:MAG: hypothetical protein RLZZ275_37 [Bacteroidota bacterium]
MPTAMNALVLTCRGCTPEIPASCWIAPNATLVGDVVLGEESTVWFGAILRGDVAPIRIGKRVNIQDAVVLHGTYEQSQTDIGDGASIGHGAIIHGARIGAQVLVGMGAVVMDGADIGTGAVIAAGAVVLAGTVVPAGTLWAGVPARQVGPVKPELAERLAATSDRYVEYADWFRSGGAD